jgi:hypothetical protein
VTAAGPGSLPGPLGYPAPTASLTSGITAPGASARVAAQPPRTGRILLVNGHRSSNCAGPRDIASEIHQIWVCDDSIGYVDREIIRRIASATLRKENQIPGAVIWRAGVGSCGQQLASKSCHDRERMFIHDGPSTNDHQRSKAGARPGSRSRPLDVLLPSRSADQSISGSEPAVLMHVNDSRLGQVVKGQPR